MRTIELVVGGRSYAISCDEGEEAHVAALGRVIDEKFQAMGPRYSQNLLFASLQLADELHEARKAHDAALADKRKVQEGYDAFRETTAAERREADTVLGQRDEMRAKINQLEQELDRMQSAQQSAAEESAGIRSELSLLREKEAEWEADEKRLRSEIAELGDALENGPVASQPSMPFFQPEPQAADREDDELADALERFARLLEDTADKLESGAGAP